MSSDNIKVVVRARPLKKSNNSLPWIINEKTIHQVDEVGAHVGDVYTYDEVYDMTTKNCDIYQTSISSLVNSAIEGINLTIFAYGATSSGKTYTMNGTQTDPGIIPMFIKDIFGKLESCNHRKFLMSVSYVEIYQEIINDLLDKNNKDLKIREDINNCVSYNPTEKIVKSCSECMDVIKIGSCNRTTGETNMNSFSSRSHSIFRIVIESASITSDASDPVQVSHVNLIDLAGSERASLTGATGQRFKEGAHINKSLTVLGMVIRQLVEKNDYINYRDSKLTRILSNSLGGNAKTLIICNINLESLEDTASTLMFAQRAKAIKNKPKVNEIISEAALTKRYAKECSEVKKLLGVEFEKNKKLEEEREMSLQKIEELRSRIKSYEEIFIRKEKNVVKPPKRRYTISTLDAISEEKESEKSLKPFLNSGPNDDIQLMAGNESITNSRIDISSRDSNFEKSLGLTPPRNLKDRLEKLTREYHEMIDFTRAEKQNNIEMISRFDQLQCENHDLQMLAEAKDEQLKSEQKKTEQIRIDYEFILENQKKKFKNRENELLEQLNRSLNRPEVLKSASTENVPIAKTVVNTCEYEEMCKKYDTLQQQNDELHSNFRKTESESKEFKELFTDLKTRFNSLELQNSQLKIKNKSLQSKILDVEVKASTANSDDCVESLKKKIQELSSQIQELKTEKVEIENTLFDSQDRLLCITQDLDNEEKKTRKLENELKLCQELQQKVEAELLQEKEKTKKLEKKLNEEWKLREEILVDLCILKKILNLQSHDEIKNNKEISEIESANISILSSLEVGEEYDNFKNQTELTMSENDLMEHFEDQTTVDEYTLECMCNTLNREKARKRQKDEIETQTLLLKEKDYTMRLTVDIQDLQSQNEKLTSLLNEKGEIISKLECEKQDLDEEKNNLFINKNKVLEENKKLLHDIDNLKITIHDLSSTIHKNDVTISMLNSEKMDLKEETNSLCVKINDLSEQKAKLEQICNFIKQEKENVKKDYEMLISEKEKSTTSKNDIQDLQIKFTELTSSLEESKCIIEKLKIEKINSEEHNNYVEKLCEENEKFKLLMEEQTEVISKFNEEMGELKKENKNLLSLVEESKKDSFRNDIQELQIKCTDLSSSLEESKCIIEKLKIEKINSGEENNKYIEKLLEENKTLELHMKEQNGAISKLNEEMIELKKENKNLMNLVEENKKDSEVQNQQKLISELSDKNDAYKNNLTNLRIECAELSSSLEESKCIIERLKIEKFNSEENNKYVEKLLEENKTLELVVKQQNEAISKFNEEMRELKKENKNLMNLAEENKKDSEVRNQKLISELSDKNDVYKNDITNLQIRCAELSSSLEESKCIIERLKIEKINSEEKNNKYSEKLLEENQKLELLVKQQNEAISKFNEEMRELKKENKNLMNLAEENKKDSEVRNQKLISELSDKNDVYKNDITNLQIRCAELSSSLEESKCTIEKLKIEKINSEEKNNKYSEKLLEENQKLELLVKQQNEAISKFNEEMRELKKENKNLMNLAEENKKDSEVRNQKLISELSDKNDVYKNDIRNLHIKCTELSSSLEESKCIIEKLKIEKINSEEENNNYVQKLLEENEKLKLHMKEQTKAISKFNEDMMELKKENKNLINLLEENKKFQNQQKLISELSEKNDSNEQQTAKLEELISTSKNKDLCLDQLEMKIKELSEKNTEQEQHIEQLKKSNIELFDNLSSLADQKDKLKTAVDDVKHEINTKITESIVKMKEAFNIPEEKSFSKFIHQRKLETRLEELQKIEKLVLGLIQEKRGYNDYEKKLKYAAQVNKQLQADNQSLKEEMKFFRENMEKMKKTQEKLEKENRKTNDFSDNNTDQDELIESLKKSNSKLFENISLIADQKSKLESEIDDVKHEINVKITESIVKMKEAFNIPEEKTFSKIFHQRKLETRLEELQKIEKLVVHLVQEKRGYNDFEQKLKHAEQINKKLEADKQSLKDEMTFFRNNMEKMKKTQEKIISDYENELKLTNEKLKTIHAKHEQDKKKIQQLEYELQAVLKSKTSFHNQSCEKVVPETKNTEDKWKQQRNRAHDSRRSIDLNTLCSESRVDLLCQSCEKMKTEMDKLQEELENLRSKYNKLKVLCRMRNEEIQQLRRN